MKCDCENRHVPSTPVREMISRRGFLGDMSLGLGGIALGVLLEESLSASPNATYDVLPKVPHFAPKAKRVILLFQNGGPSQMDLFDPKPELNKRDGQKPARITSMMSTQKRPVAGWAALSNSLATGVPALNCRNFSPGSHATPTTSR